MPYTIIERDGEYCIYKKNADGQPFGESFGCHDSPAGAQGQIAAMYASENKARVGTDVTITNEPEGILRGYIAIWGDDSHRDSYETYFDKARPPEMDLDLLPVALRYEHGLDAQVKGERIGEVTQIGFDEEGIYFEGRLDKSCPYFDRIVAELKHGTAAGTLRTSSGTSSYLADFYEDGAFKKWPIAEVSLTSQPSEPRMPDVELVRSQRLDPAERTDLNAINEIPQPDNRGMGKPPIRSETLDRRQIMTMEQILQILGGLGNEATLQDMFAALLEAGVTIDDLKAALAQLEAPTEEPVAESAAIAGERTEGISHAQFAEALAGVIAAKNAKATVDAERSLRDQNRKLQLENAGLQARMAAPPPRQPMQGDLSQQNARITNMVDLRYDHLNPKEMALGYIIMRSKYREGMEAYNRPVSDDYYRALRVKAQERVNRGVAGWQDANNFAAARSAAYRANEIMGVGSASQEGYDWIGTYFPTEIWEVARAGRIMSEVESKGLWKIEVPEGAHSATVMLEGSDPTWYTSNSNISVDTTTLTSLPLVTQTQATTANLTVTPNKLMVRILVATELIEDSIIPALPQLNRQLEESAQNELEYAFLNGDTETGASANINLIDSTPGTAPSLPHYLVTNGVLKYALVTGSSTSRDGTTFDSADFLATQKLLPVANAADPEKLLFVSDITTRLKALEFTDVKTISERADGGTINTGRLEYVYGVRYLASAQMALAYTAGKISNTGGNNTKGRLAIIYPQYWAMVWKRQITFKQAEDIEGDVTKLVGSMRFAFQYRGAGASACTYNLTV